MSNQHCLAIIPARYGSTRFPGKALAMIAGKTLLQRTYENALRCKALSKILIATDDERIFSHALSFGAEVLMTSVECSTGTDRLAEVIRKYPNLDGDFVLNIQGDEPCVEPSTLENVLHALAQDPLAVMSTAVEPLNCAKEALDPNIVKCTMDSKFNALYFSRSLIPATQKGTFCPETTYYRHLGIYAYRRDFLPEYANLPKTPLQQVEELEQLKALEYGYRIKVAVVANQGSIGVDTPEDIQKVENFLNLP